MSIPLRRLAASATVALLASTMMPAGATVAGPRGPHAHLSAAQKALIASVQSKVKYVFVFYQENRSFDSLFGTFPGANGIYSQPAAQTPGYNQTIYNTDGSTSVLNPFRIDASPWYAADLDDADHSHQGLLSAEDIQNGTPLMDGYALDEENKYTPGVGPSNPPSQQSKQYGELVMGHIDCDTTPLMWNYANKFTLFDNIFQTAVGPSTPGNIAIFTGQTGITQLEEHPSEAYTTNGNSGIGVPDLNDANPFWGSSKDPNAPQNKMPYNPGDNPNSPELSLTFASLPLLLAGKSLNGVVSNDRSPSDLADVQQDVSTISEGGIAKPIDWGWWEEGFDQEPTDNGNPASHNSYVTHHNGPQYFGYLSDNPVEQTHFHGLGDFFNAVSSKSLSKTGGVYWIKGGYTNLFGLTPTDPDPAVQKNFLGDDDHPAYSDSQISDATVALAINAIAKSPYWSKSAIIIAWDDSEGYYDHVPPPTRASLPGVGIVSEGPRVPLIVISPFAKTGYVSHVQGDQGGSVSKLVETVFGLQSLASLPDEYAAAAAGQQAYGQPDLGPLDDFAPNVDSLLDAFDEAKIDGFSKPLPAGYVEIPAKYITQLPGQTGLSCATLGITPTDVALGIGLTPPSDFNPRPGTDPPPPMRGVRNRASTNRLDD